MDAVALAELTDFVLSKRQTCFSYKIGHPDGLWLLCLPTGESVGSGILSWIDFSLSTEADHQEMGEVIS